MMVKLFRLAIVGLLDMKLVEWSVGEGGWLGGCDLMEFVNEVRKLRPNDDLLPEI